MKSFATLAFISAFLLLGGCAAGSDTSKGQNFFKEIQDRKQSDVVSNASTVSARLRALVPGSALYNQLENSCKQGKIVEVIVPAETAASLNGKKTCFPVYFSLHPNVKPQADVLLVDRTDLFVGGGYYGSNTPEVLQEYQFQRYIKVNGF